jgi:hypothetical protein
MEQQTLTVDQALDYRRFKEWLDGYGTMAIGVPGQPAACPLAFYLRETAPAATAICVGRTKIEYREAGRRRVLDLPLWARRFVEGVDRSSAPLMAEEAANVLLPREVLSVEEEREERRNRKPAAHGVLRRLLAALTPSAG